MVKNDKAELQQLAREAEQSARESSEPIRWDGVLPKPSPYMLDLVRRSLDLTADELSDEGAMILLAQMAKALSGY